MPRAREGSKSRRTSVSCSAVLFSSPAETTITATKESANGTIKCEKTRFDWGKAGCTDPFVEDLGPLLGQSPVEQDSPHLLGRLIYREVHADHGTDDVSELCGLQFPCEKRKKNRRHANLVIITPRTPHHTPPDREKKKKDRTRRKMK
jgi:hypothetical protein